MLTSLRTWSLLRRLELPVDGRPNWSLPGVLTPLSAAALGALTQLTALSLRTIGSHPQGETFRLGSVPLAQSLTGLRRLELDRAVSGGLGSLSRGCSALTHLELFSLTLDDGRDPGDVACFWPSLVELCLEGCQEGVAAHVLPSAGSAPNLKHLPFNW